MNPIDLTPIIKFSAEERPPAYAATVLIGAGAAQLAVEAMKSRAHDCLEKDRAKVEDCRAL